MTLSVDGLTVERGGRLLFRDLSFQVAPGEILFVSGRNGTGKSSLLRVLAGLLEAVTGRVSYAPPSASHALGTSPALTRGEDVSPASSPHGVSHAGEVRPKGGMGGDFAENFHFCGHLDAVKPAMMVRETLAFWASLYGGPKDGVARALGDWSLKALADLPGQYLSAGQKRRVALARLSVAPRPVWLLDEPSAALDSTAKSLLIARGDAHIAGGGIIVVASHEPLWPNARTLSLDARAQAAA
jgi:heme exporter protein A